MTQPVRTYVTARATRNGWRVTVFVNGKAESTLTLPKQAVEKNLRTHGG